MFETGQGRPYHDHQVLLYHLWLLFGCFGDPTHCFIPLFLSFLNIDGEERWDDRGSALFNDSVSYKPHEKSADPLEGTRAIGQCRLLGFPPAFSIIQWNPIFALESDRSIHPESVWGADTLSQKVDRTAETKYGRGANLCVFRQHDSFIKIEPYYLCFQGERIQKG